MAEGKYFYIRSQMHHKVVDIKGAEIPEETEAGTRCIMWDQKDSSENSNQLFYECPLTGVIRPKIKPDFCLDVDEENDCNLCIMPYQPGDREQAWDLTDDMLVNRSTGKALDIAGADDSDGANCLAWDIHGEINQKWRFDYQPARYFYLVSELNGKVLDVEGADSSPGTKVIMWSRKEDAEDNQLWYEDKRGYVRSKINDFFLDVNDDGEMILNPGDGDDVSSSWQKWALNLEKDGGSQLICSVVNVDERGDVLDIFQKNDDDGATVGKWGFNGGSNQMWRIEYIN
jgi:hypothetical protein